MNKKFSPKKFGYLLNNLIIIFLLLIFDQWTKTLALDKLKGTSGIPLIPKVFELYYLENRGIAFGMLQDQKIPIIIVSMVLLIAVLVMLRKLQESQHALIMRICLLLIAAGGIGNMIDRVIRGFVVDFFSFVLIHFPVFNVADIFIVCGTFVMCFVVLFLWDDKATKEQ